MTSLLFENPWPLAAILAVLAGVSAWWSVQRAQKRFLWLALFFLALIPLVFALDAWIETASEAVENRLEGIRQGALRQDAEPIVRALSPTYQYGGYSANSLSAAVRNELANYRPDSLSFNGLTLQGDSNRQVARFVAVTAGQYRSIAVRHYPVRLELTFVKEGGDWRITQIRRFEPIGNAGKEIPLQTH